jgi:hypothetical protein
MKTIQGYFSLAIPDLRKLWSFVPTHLRLSVSRGGAELAAIEVESHSDKQITLRYEYGGAEKITQVIKLQSSSCHFGGERRWFVCPSCGKPKGVLFCARYFHCRTCLGLTYASQAQTSPERRINRIVARRRKLGSSGSLREAFPAKPKRMRWKTYLGLWAIDDHECALFFSQTLATFERQLKSTKMLPADDEIVTLK